MRVVIVAEHASSQFGGEAFLPLHYFRLLRDRNIEAWLVVHGRTQAELQSLLPKECDRMYFVNDTWIHKFLWRFGQFLPSRVAFMTTGLISHLYTQNIQRSIVRKLVLQHNIDVVHEPIPVSPKFPSLMYGVGAPVVIGPMNGNIEYPPAFRDRESRSAKLMISLGQQLADIWNRVMPGKLQAQTLLVANERTKQALPSGVNGTVIELVENGVDFSVWQLLAAEKIPSEAAKFVFIGRLVEMKAVDLLIEAFQKVAAETNACLEIIGDGNLRQELEAQAVNLGLGERVKFFSWLSQKECAMRLEHASALVLPSLLECGGAVVLEAMAMGLPVIATKWGGPADYLDTTCGILIEPTSREALVNGFTDAMLKLVHYPEWRSQMGRAGQERVRQHFDWERKIDRILEIYQHCSVSNLKTNRKLKSLITNISI
ncbi:group 1 glycosyl transferase [Tolypothrix sp. NIES-4075]|uniref:glycosyltransferase family 4 protein n=1 Tax=Tolypothrix sp. NIES-4075 TaxID=2005459 RepID=UPI000B5C5159|nr:glycosyltransferase family 4 protein [Tolypothrix sp. NIES-4075]GAX40940.1 group 1 glycosyl transferase [Tolypothrix sp. NIES-4075]